MEDEKAKKDQERSETMAKLKREFDEHLVNVMEKNKDYKYDSGFTPENFEEELRKVPAFINEAPTQADIDASPALAALQALKYEETDPEECALSHKDDGNYNFKRKDYKKAILAYTEGLKQDLKNNDLKVILLTNRAAANFHLENHRSSLKDAREALKLNNKHMKALIRAAMCCFELKLFGDCIKVCDDGLQNVHEKRLFDLRKQASEEKKKQDRDNRKQEKKNKAIMEKQRRIVNAIKKRGIKIEKPKNFDLDEDKDAELEMFYWMTSTSLNKPQSGKLFLDEKNDFYWPVYFLYPEYNQSDFIEDFNENHRFMDHLMVMFDSNSLPDWDEKRLYAFGNLVIYFENRQRDTLVKIRSSQSLKEILSDNRYMVCNGAPSFLVLSSASEFFSGFSKSVSIEKF